MKLKIKFDFSACNRIEACLVALIVLFTVLKNNMLISLCFAMSFVVLLFYVITQHKKINNLWLCSLAIISLSLINVLINGVTSQGATLNFDYFKKVIMFSAFVLMCYFSSMDSVSSDTVRLVLKLPCVEGIILVLSYFFYGNTDVQGGGITLGFSNPNFTGMWLLHISIYSFLLCIRKDINWLLRIIAVVFLVFEVRLLIMTGARSCMIGIILFAFFCFLGKLGLKKIINNHFTVFLLVSLPIIFVAVYSSLLESEWFVNTFSFMVSSGKGLGSRLGVWNPAIEIFRKNVILGDYAEIERGIGAIRTKQLHNMHLDVLCSYGTAPFILFVMLLYGICIKIGKKADDYFSYCAFCGFLSIIVMGIFEAGVVAGSMGLNLLTTGLILLANNHSIS